MAEKKDEVIAYNLFGWGTELAAEQPGHIVFSVMFAASEENRKAGKLNRLRLVLSQKKALELSRDLAEVARVSQQPAGPRARH